GLSGASAFGRPIRDVECRVMAEPGLTIAKYCVHFNDRNALRTGCYRWDYSSGEPSPLFVLAPELPGACNGEDWRRGSESNRPTRIFSPLTRQENQCLSEFATLFCVVALI